MVKVEYQPLKKTKTSLQKTFSTFVINCKVGIDIYTLLRIKCVCATKEAISKVKRQPSEWEKIIANEATKD